MQISGQFADILTFFTQVYGRIPVKTEIDLYKKILMITQRLNSYNQNIKAIKVEEQKGTLSENWIRARDNTNQQT